jgi:hypothetical protein
MRYAFYITRAQHWSFEARERHPISEAEWSAYAQTDAELHPLLSLPYFDARTGQEVGQVPVAKTWEWIGHPRAGSKSVTRQSFEYNRGGIIVRAPDSELLRKAVAVARAFGARVIGDDDQVISDPAAG